MKENTRHKHDNIKRVLSEIRTNAPISKRDIQDNTGFSWGMVSTVVNELEQQGFIVTAGKQEIAVGRKSDLYDINTACNLFVGVDFSFQGLRLVVTNLRGHIVYRSKETFYSLEKDEALRILFSHIDSAMCAVLKENVCGISLGMQGVVDSKQGISAHIGGIRHWTNVPIASLIEEKYAVPCTLLHDPDCVMRTEMNRGWLYKKNVNTALLIRLEKYAVGMSIVMNGNLCVGERERAGELGSVLVPFKNELGWAFVESLIPEALMAKNYEKMFPDSQYKMTYDLLAELVKVKEQTAIRFAQEWSLALGILLINIANLFNPEQIIIFGELTNYSSIYEEQVLGLLKESALDKAVKLLFSKQDAQSAAIGAALWGADKWLENFQLQADSV